MKLKIFKDINKIILIILFIFMIIPSTINIFGISIFKIFAVLISIIFLYFIIKKRVEIKELLRNLFVLNNIVFCSIILLVLIFNYRTVQLNDFFEIVKYIIFTCVTIIVMTICKEKKYLFFFLNMISISYIILGVFGILQYFNPFSINELYIKSYAPTQYVTLVNNYPTPRIVGLKSNPSVYGLFAAMGIYFNLFNYRYTKHKKMCIVSIILCIINIVLTLTRTIQVAFIVSLIAFILINVSIKKGIKNAFIAVGILIIILGVMLMILPESITFRIFQMADFSHASSWVGRVEKWNNYFAIIKNNIFIGIGPVKNYVDTLDYVDSEHIQNMLQYGILGIISYLSLIFSPIYIYIKEKRKNYKNLDIIKYYIPIAIMVLINNISASSLASFESAVPIYIFIGIILSSNKEVKES